MGLDISEMVPSFNINKIIIFEKSIRLLCSLEKENPTSDSWLGSSEFLQYLDMYVLVTKTLSAPEVSEYYWPSSRVQSLATNRDLDSWTNRWEDAEVRREHGIVGYKVINFDEIVNGKQYFPADQAVKPNSKASAFFSDPMSVQNDFNASMEDNTFFEIEIPLGEEWLSPPQAVPGQAIVPSSDPHRNLLAFVHLDIKQLAHKYNLSNFSGFLSRVGGQLHYEKILELRDDTYRRSLGENSEDYLKWMVPEFISYYEDRATGNIYRGQAHYHKPQFEGRAARVQDRYEGYLEGPAELGPGEENLDNRRRLIKRRVRNTKVVSKLFLEQALGWDGKPLTSTNKFNGYRGMLLTGAPPLMRDSGGSPVAQARAQVGMAAIAVDAVQEMADTTGEVGASEVNPMNTLYGKMLKRIAIRGAANAKASITQGYAESAPEITNGIRSNYLTVINLNFENLIKSHSKHGYFIDFHRDALDQEVTNASQFGSPANPSQVFSPEFFSHQFIKQCLLRSRIYSMNIKRRRLTNLPISNNPLGTNDYQNYDTNQIEEHLIMATTQPQSNFGDLERSSAFQFPSAENTRVSIQLSTEDPVGMDYSPEGYVVPFALRDYDLFNRVQTGKYAYSISINVRDGISEYLETFCDLFEGDVHEYSKFLNAAQSPYQVIHIDDEKIASGNYDYEKEVFTSEFKDSYNNNGGLKTRMSSLVKRYMQAVYLLTKRKSTFNIETRNNLLNMITPEQGQVSSMKAFLDACKKILNTLKSVVYEGRPEIEKTINLGTHKRIANKRSENPNKMIQIDGIIKNAVEALPKNAVFCEVSGDELVFFTLTESGAHTPSTREGSDSTTEETSVEDDVVVGALGSEPFQYDSSGNVIAKSSGFYRTEIGRGLSAYGKVVGTTYHSSTKETYDHETTSEHTDPVDDINGALSQFGGTTLNYLLSQTVGNVDTEINQCGEVLETEREITSDIEGKIVESITTSENKETFIKEINDIYKDHYFTKKGLGGLYDFVIQLMASKKNLKKADENLQRAKKKKKGADYEKLVKKGKSRSEQKAESRKNRNSETDPQKMVSISTEVMTTKGEWVDIALEPNNSLKIYRHVVASSISNSENIYLVNNLKVPTNSQGITPLDPNGDPAKQSQSETESDSSSSDSESQSTTSSGGISHSGTSGTGTTSSGGSY